jgi:hypothetical protein
VTSLTGSKDAGGRGDASAGDSRRAAIAADETSLAARLNLATQPFIFTPPTSCREFSPQRVLARLNTMLGFYRYCAETRPKQIVA